MSNIGRAIRVLRASRGETQRVLAERSGLSTGFISMLEAGSKKPSMNALERIAEALDVPLDRLMSVAEHGIDPGPHSPGPSARTATGTDRPAHPPADVPLPLAPSQRGEHFARSRQNAEQTLRDLEASQRLLDEARAKATGEESWRLGGVRDDLFTLLDLLEHYVIGDYRSASWESMVLIAAALLYFVSPIDIVPDYLEAGYIDDAAIFAFVAEMAGPDLDNFIHWQVTGGPDKVSPLGHA